MCPLCRRRKGKRYCPAIGEKICAACCGSKRRVEIACPEDCVYLTGAHAAAWEGRVTEHERDMRRLAPFVQELSDDAARLVFLALTGVGALGSRDVSLDDARLADALATLAKTCDTRDSGLVYEHRADDPRVQAVVDELEALLHASPETADGSAGDWPRPAARSGDVASAVKAMAAAVAAARRENAGDRAFVETAERLAARFGSPVSREPDTGPLIVEP